MALCLLLMLSPPAVADSGSQQVQLAANGRFDQLEQLLEAEAARGPLRTRDRHALCYAYARTKRYDRLMPCLDALAESVQRGDRRTRLFGLDDATPSIHLMRAEALIELGQYSQAVTEAQAGLDWLQRDRSDDLDMVIQSQAAVALAYTLAGDREAGTQQAEALARIRVSGLRADYAGAKALALGRVYMALGAYAKAAAAIESDTTFGLRSFLDNLVSGAFLRGTNNWVWAELPRHFMLTKALFESGRLDEARQGYDELLKIPQVRANGEIHWQLLADRARIADRDGQLDQALALYHQAIAVIERQRLSIHTEASKIGFIGDKQAVYGRMVEALLRAGRAGEAFEIIERAKSRALVDLLAAREQRAAPLLVARHSEPLLAELRQASAADLAQPPLDMALPSPVQAGAGTARAVQALQAADPELASLVSVSAVPLLQVQQGLLPDEVVLQYYLQGRQLTALTVSRDAVQASTIDQEGLEAEVRRWRQLIDANSAEALPAAQALYNRLIRPVQAHLAGKSLLVVPHGPLHYLPFAALHDGQRWLLDTHLLRYLPSASVMQFIPPARSSGLQRVLVLGNPDLGQPQYDLPHAEEEARAIARMVADSTLLLRREASEGAFRRLAPTHHYIHVASHGEFNAADALQSRLLLAPTGDDDGSLNLADLYNMRLDAELVTLSACETGLGQVLSGDDVLGLTRGFLYAGTRNIVASHWPVDDLATGVLMQHFYRSLQQGVPKREALRQAQVATRAEFPHPFYWAAFFITGSGQ